MELHQKIISLRKKKGLTQEQLATLIKVTVRTVQRIESGENVPRPYTLKAIAAALDITFEELTVAINDSNAAGSPAPSATRQMAGDEQYCFRPGYEGAKCCCTSIPVPVCMSC